jgi:hypothetical protein
MKAPSCFPSSTDADILGFAMISRDEGMSSTDQTVQVYQLRIWIRQISP